METGKNKEVWEVFREVGEEVTGLVSVEKLRKEVKAYKSR